MKQGIDSQTTSSRPGFLAAWVTLAGLTLLSFLAASWTVWSDVGRPLFGVDDANIFFVYARNLAGGHGIVYSVGGEHVEGASSMLYLLLCTALWSVSSHPEPLLFILNFAFVLAVTAAIFRLLYRLEVFASLARGTALVLSAFFVLWLLLNPCYFMWSVTSLMDGGIYGMLLVLGFVSLAKRTLDQRPPTPARAALFGLLLTSTLLARPEGLGWAVLEAVLFAVICRFARTRPPLAVLLLPAGILSVSATALIAFRKAYFGFPLPNTYYAKMSASRVTTLRDGLFYLREFLHLYGFLPVLIGLATAALLLWHASQAWRQRQPWPPLLRFLAVTMIFAVTGFLLPILEGGDHFNGLRMYQPAYPFFVLLAMVFLLSVLRSYKVLTAALAALTLAFALSGHDSWHAFQVANQPGGPGGALTWERLDFTIATEQRDNGEKLRRFFGFPLPTIASAAAGGLAYGYDGTFIDTMGLNYVAMAHASPIKAGPKGHESFNRDVFYEHPPEVLHPQIFPNGPAPDIHVLASAFQGPGFTADIYKNLFTEPRFRSLYTLAVLRNPRQPDLLCYGFFRNDILADLVRERGLLIVEALHEQNQPAKPYSAP